DRNGRHAQPVIPGGDAQDNVSEQLRAAYRSVARGADAALVAGRDHDAADALGCRLGMQYFRHQCSAIPRLPGAADDPDQSGLPYALFLPDRTAGDGAPGRSLGAEPGTAPGWPLETAPGSAGVRRCCDRAAGDGAGARSWIGDVCVSAALGGGRVPAAVTRQT